MYKPHPKAIKVFIGYDEKRFKALLRDLEDLTEAFTSFYEDPTALTEVPKWLIYLYGSTLSPSDFNDDEYREVSAEDFLQQCYKDWPRNPQDWSEIPKGTEILVKDEITDGWIKGCFSEYSQENIYPVICKDNHVYRFGKIPK